MQPATDETTRLLRRIRKGDREAASRLLAIVYEELHGLAEQQMARERPDHTLQATALVNEAFLRLFERQGDWRSRYHFLCTASRAMRNILVDHARSKGSAKRGGRHHRLALEDITVSYDPPEMDHLALDNVLDRLALHNEELVRIVELRFYAGVTLAEIAKMLNMSEKMVERRWLLARSWLHRELGKGDSDEI